jgi:hypothetical protein
METQPASEAPVKKNQNIVLIAAVAIVLCCFCLLIAGIALYSYSAIRGGDPQEFPPPFESTVPVLPDDSELPSQDSLSTPDSPDSDDGMGEAPEGGLGNDILRNDTWQVVSSSAVGQGCDSPVAANSTIAVLQEPDAGGVWLEKWTVACRSGDEYAYEVEYILDDTGATFNITSLPE